MVETISKYKIETKEYFVVQLECVTLFCFKYVCTTAWYNLKDLTQMDLRSLDQNVQMITVIFYDFDLEIMNHT